MQSRRRDGEGALPYIQAAPGIGGIAPLLQTMHVSAHKKHDILRHVKTYPAHRARAAALKGLPGADSSSFICEAEKPHFLKLNVDWEQLDERESQAIWEKRRQIDLVERAARLSGIQEEVKKTPTKRKLELAEDGEQAEKRPVVETPQVSAPLQPEQYSEKSSPLETFKALALQRWLEDQQPIDTSAVVDLHAEPADFKSMFEGSDDELPPPPPPPAEGTDDELPPPPPPSVPVEVLSSQPRLPQVSFN